jgi:membrane protein
VADEGGSANRSASNQSFLAQFYYIWITERPSQFAAMLAYYALFSFVPLIYIALTVAGIFIDELRAADQLYARVGEALGPEASQLLEDGVNSLAERTTGETTLTTAIGFVALLLTASVLFFQLQHALNTIWRLPPPQRGQTRLYILNRLLAFVMVIGLGLLLVLVSFANIVITGLSSRIDLGGTLPVTSVLSVIVLLTFMLALLYKVLPNARVAWLDVLVGSLVAAVLLTLGGYLLGLYLGASKFSSALDAAGGVAVFLMTFYFIGQIIVFGAVFTRVYASVYGSKIVPRGEPSAELSAEKPLADGEGQPPETPEEQQV